MTEAVFRLKNKHCAASGMIAEGPGAGDAAPLVTADVRAADVNAQRDRSHGSAAERDESACAQPIDPSGHGQRVDISLGSMAVSIVPEPYSKRGTPDGLNQMDAEASLQVRCDVRHGSACGSVVVTTVSEYGVKRDREYRSSCELAQALVEAMEGGDEAVRGSFRDIRVTTKGIIVLTSWAHWRARGQAGYLLCPACGRYVPLIVL